MNRAEARVTIYTTRSCIHCRQGRKFFQRHSIQFRDYDVERNQRALKEFQHHGARSVPLNLVGDKSLVGFDERQITRMLRISGYHV